MTGRPSDAAVGRAYRELLKEVPGLLYPYTQGEIARRARELDAGVGECRACNPTDADLREFANEENMSAQGMTPGEGFVSVRDRYPCTCTQPTTPPAAVVPEGFVLVPREPTEAILQAMHLVDIESIQPDGESSYGPTVSASAIHAASYRAAIAAAPAQEVGNDVA